MRGRGISGQGTAAGGCGAGGPGAWQVGVQGRECDESRSGEGGPSGGRGAAAGGHVGGAGAGIPRGLPALILTVQMGLNAEAATSLPGPHPRVC